MIQKITDKSFWYKWLFSSKNTALDESNLSSAVEEITNKLNEVIDELNKLKS